jgi:hypothetical protein
MHNGASWPTVDQLLSLPNEELGKVDPVVMNLVVAKGIPALANLDIDHYIRLADQWAADFRTQMPAMERCFHQESHLWQNDIDLFFIGMTFRYVAEVLGVRYHEDQTDIQQILYTNPSDLFLNGILDTRRGNCGTMALLHVILGNRIGMPVYLVRIWSHFLYRFDNGSKKINVEATITRPGKFFTGTDEQFLAKFNQPAKAKACGSDMHSLTPRQLLGTFIGMRGRHFRNTPHFFEAERDYLLARYLFPESRDLYLDQSRLSTQCSTARFEPDEEGHPFVEVRRLSEFIRFNNGDFRVPTEPPLETIWPQEKQNGRHADTAFHRVCFA